MHSGSRLPLVVQCRVLLARYGMSLAVVFGGLVLSFQALGCNRAGAERSESENVSGVTDIAIEGTVQRANVKRLGINIAGQTYYDSGQMLRNLTFRNPGFEGGTWQSILRCKLVTATSCTDGNVYASWPNDFLKGAEFEFISGPAKGLKGPVLSSSKSGTADPSKGVTFTFGRLPMQPALDDFVLVRFSQPGGPEKGWWTSASEGATFAAELKDLSPNSPGRQALRINSAGLGQSAELNSYFDTYTGKSFLTLRGNYRLSFRAKGDGGNNSLSVSIVRQGTAVGNEVLFPVKTVKLTNKWKDYSYDWTASEDGNLTGSIDLRFSISEANILLDDVLVTEEASKTNPTAFRNAVVDTLEKLKPGIIRYTDTGADTGSTIDNMIAPPFARLRAGYSTQSTVQEDIPLGLHEALQLCQVVGAEPWYSLPATASPEEVNHLIEYLAGPSSSVYGSKRAALGQVAPWTTVFRTIHIEYGNELWNQGTFYGAAIADPAVYGRRAGELFGAARSSSWYEAEKFDLILGSWAAVPWWTSQELANSSHYDSIAIAPYLFYKLEDTSSSEAIFGPMFAEPEMIDALDKGYVVQQAKAARNAPHPTRLSVYEVNLGTESGAAPQSMVDAVVPSIAAGLTLTEHMLLMMRDLGITDQAAYALPGHDSKFNNPADRSERMPLWGMVIDMGGPKKLQRSQFLAEELANEAILPTMLETKLTGANPTWRQTKSKNNDIEIDRAHYLQTFAFSDGVHRSLIVFNLSRDRALPITVSGKAAPAASVEVSQLTSKQITDNNERSEAVVIRNTSPQNIHTVPYSLPPFSMTVFKWNLTP